MSSNAEYQENVLKITPWYCDDYLREILDIYAPIDEPIENLSKNKLKSQIVKLPWLLTRDGISRNDMLIKLHSLGYKKCDDCGKWEKTD